MEIRPYHLLCTICRLGDAADEPPVARLAEILRAVRENPLLPLTLRCHADSVYRAQNPGRAEDTPESELFNEKRDLDILQRLGLVPGATRPARELFYRVLQRIESTRGICGYAEVTAPAWRGCSRATSGDYERQRTHGIAPLFPPRPEEDKARVKTESAHACYSAKVLYLRPHHLMCMACFHGGQEQIAPIAEDNLFEAIDVMRHHPEMPVTLVRGCCMICPPCSNYDPASGLCVAPNGMSLRDQKKDLDLLQRLGLQYGDTLPARELYQRLFRAIRSTTEICGYGDGVERGWEWTACGGADGNDGYRRARACGLGWLPPMED